MTGRQRLRLWLYLSPMWNNGLERQAFLGVSGRVTGAAKNGALVLSKPRGESWDFCASHYLHRGPAAAGAPEGAARFYRLRRGGLLCRADVARQPHGSRTDRVSP